MKGAFPTQNEKEKFVSGRGTTNKYNTLEKDKLLNNRKTWNTWDIARNLYMHFLKTN